MFSNFKIKYSAKSDVGMKRTSNQDSYIVEEDIGLYAVADGMGGHSGGEVASALAVKTLQKVLADELETKTDADALVSAVDLSNKVIYSHAKKNAELKGMGTTLTACMAKGDYIHIAQVGDSRCYVFQDKTLFQITEDHSQVYEMLKAGLIDESIMDSFQSNVITRSVGFEEDISIDLFTRVAKKGDIYLICSDGLTGMVTDEQIAQILYNFNIDQAADNLIELANARGGDDNISVVLFQLK